MSSPNDIIQQPLVETSYQEWWGTLTGDEIAELSMYETWKASWNAAAQAQKAQDAENNKELFDAVIAWDDSQLEWASQSMANMDDPPTKGELGVIAREIALHKVVNKIRDRAAILQGGDAGEE